MLYRHRWHTKRVKMAVRLYHRRSSATREKIQTQNGLSPSTALRLQALGACGPRNSLSIGVNRPRSQSLFPGSPHCLSVPPRSRSLSFSGSSRPGESNLTTTEEEHIFQCYTRVMYILLGGLAAMVLGFIVYGVKNFSNLR
ncbi:uncharacterized protein CDAR_534391 [Caerostris darwini]|uniref:Uncharacterized protein n=2 Tax=Caerostris TaxID=172845 RepID=A0AAV4QCD6_9ARAC|nr:uncharacterized protein CDAR_534391 [Caerostris darwini]GIY96530.1 uncharacterized protein CEXT_311681 [Caerostris extrusa]